MSDSKFKTMRHIETVRNYLNAVVIELLRRQEQHDQSKLEQEEADAYDKIIPQLRGMTYGSDEYRATLKQVKPAIQHHYAKNRHHPEHYKNGYLDMTLVDLLEMMIDWKCASMRHDDGDVYRSVEINQGRFGYSDELKTIFLNTLRWLEEQQVYHKANES